MKIVAENLGFGLPDIIIDEINDIDEINESKTPDNIGNVIKKLALIKVLKAQLAKWADSKKININSSENLHSIHSQTELDEAKVHWHNCHSCDIKWSHRGNAKELFIDDNNIKAHLCPQCHVVDDYHPKKMETLGAAIINYPNWKGDE